MMTMMPPPLPGTLGGFAPHAGDRSAATPSGASAGSWAAGGAGLGAAAGGSSTSVDGDGAAGGGADGDGDGDGSGVGAKRKRLGTLRACAGEVWEDKTLLEWAEGDFRLWAGDLGNEVNDDVLAAAFRRFPSFARAKVVRDSATHKSRGYGFVSFLDPKDALAALKEMHGQYVGNRPVRLQRCQAEDKDAREVRRRDAERVKARRKLGL
jgi:hypothetical protein